MRLCVYSMCIVKYLLKMLTLAQLLTVPTYFDGFSWHLGKRILGYGHTCDPKYFLDAMISCVIRQGHILRIM